MLNTASTMLICRLITAICFSTCMSIRANSTRDTEITAGTVGAGPRQRHGDHVALRLAQLPNRTGTGLAQPKTL